jgi:nucleoid DNA-binding protein
VTRRVLAARLAAATGLSARQAAQVLAAVPALLADELAATGQLHWRGLGTFTVRTYPARRIHVPATRKTISLPARKSVAYKPSRTVRERLAKPSPRPSRRRST